MPERIFAGLNFSELKTTLASLRADLSKGGTIELQVSGIRTRTGNVSHEDRKDLIIACRLELFRVVTAMDDSDPNKAALLLDYTDPRLEKIMRVETRQRLSTGGSFLIGTV